MTPGATSWARPYALQQGVVCPRRHAPAPGGPSFVLLGLALAASPASAQPRDAGADAAPADAAPPDAGAPSAAPGDAGVQAEGPPSVAARSTTDRAARAAGRRGARVLAGQPRPHHRARPRCFPSTWATRGRWPSRRGAWRRLSRGPRRRPLRRRSSEMPARRAMRPRTPGSDAGVAQELEVEPPPYPRLWRARLELDRARLAVLALPAEARKKLQEQHAARQQERDATEVARSAADARLEQAAEARREAEEQLRRGQVGGGQAGGARAGAPPRRQGEASGVRQHPHRRGECHRRARRGGAGVAAPRRGAHRRRGAGARRTAEENGPSLRGAGRPPPRRGPLGLSTALDDVSEDSRVPDAGPDTLDSAGAHIDRASLDRLRGESRGAGRGAATARVHAALGTGNRLARGGGVARTAIASPSIHGCHPSAPTT